MPNPDFSTNNDLAMQGNAKSEGGLAVAAISAIALAFSAYSLWETSLKSSDLQIFVPPVIYYSSPYNNSNFEMIQIPVTIQEGTIFMHSPDWAASGKSPRVPRPDLAPEQKAEQAPNTQ